MAADRPRHPSGRPIHNPVTRRPFSIARDPEKGPLIARLRDPEPRDAIGFHYIRSVRAEDDETH